MTGRSPGQRLAALAARRQWQTRPWLRGLTRPLNSIALYERKWERHTAKGERGQEIISPDNAPII